MYNLRNTTNNRQEKNGGFLPVPTSENQHQEELARKMLILKSTAENERR